MDRPKRNGEDQGADFIRVTVWGRQAETCDRYLSKGRQIAVMGRIQTGSYKNRKGETVDTTDVVADRVEFLGGGQQQSQPQADTAEVQRQAEDLLMPKQEKQISGFDDLPETFAAAEDELPF